VRASGDWRGSVNNPRIVYRTNPTASPGTDLNTLALVYHFILDCKAQKETADRVFTPNDCEANDDEPNTNLSHNRRGSA
jgi:hypothetical protein